MDTFLSLSAWLMLSGIWDMLISFCSNIAKTEATTACSWSRFYFIEEFDASSTTTCSNVIFSNNTQMPFLSIHWQHLHSFIFLREVSVSLSHNLCFTYMCIFRYVNIWACVCLFMHTWSPQFDLGVSSSIALHLNFFFFDISWKWRLSIQQSSLWPSGQKQEDPHVSTLSSMKVTGTCSHASVFNVGFQDLTSAPHHRLSNTLQIKLFS